MGPYVIPKDPLLRWGLLLPNKRISLPAPLNGRRVWHLFWARNALFHGVKALRLPAGSTILAPAYHCVSAIEPLRQAGAQVRYYNVTRDGSVDFKDIEARFDRSVKAMLAIHYFGFPQQIGRLQAWCMDRRVRLIEDCAHVLTGQNDGRRLGTFGDIAVFSYRKLLPLYDGGQLVLNDESLEAPSAWEQPSWIYSLKEMKGVLDKIADESGGAVTKAMSALIRVPSKLLRQTVADASRSGLALAVNSCSVEFDATQASIPISRWSRRIMGNVSVQEVAERRRANYAALVKLLGSVKGVQCLFPDLGADVCPWVCPVIVPDRTDLHVQLRALGIPAATWGGVIHPSLPAREFPDARFLYDHGMFLPVHQDLTASDLDLMAVRIRESLRGRGRSIQV